MVGLLDNLGNHIIPEIGSQRDMVRQPVFRPYTNIESGHVMIRYPWFIVGSSEPRNDKWVEFTFRHKVKDGIDMIKVKVHVIHGKSELSFLYTRK